VWTSIRAGDGMLFFEEYDDYYKFLYFPGNDFFCLTKQDFNQYVSQEILVFVECMPQDIFDETIKYSLSCLQKAE